MAFNNLGDLKTAVADWLNRQDLDAVIPDFVRMGVDRINSDNRAKHRFLIQQDATLTAAQQVNPFPLTTVTKVETFAVNDKIIPQVIYEVYVRELERGFDAWCLGENDEILFTGFEGVDPSAADVDVTIRGYAQPAFTNYSVDSSTFAEYQENPSVYLFAALTEAAIYLRDVEGIGMYQARYDELLDKLYRDYKRQQVMGGMAVSSIGAD